MDREGRTVFVADVHRNDFRLAVRSRLKYARPMKIEKYHLYVLLLVIFTCCAFAGCQTSNSASGTSMAPTSKNAGHLIVRRAAKFGSRVALNVSIDGAHVALLGQGQSYNGTLSTGEHVISVNVTPSQARGGAATKRLTVQAGQTYSFTATWTNGRVALM